MTKGRLFSCRSALAGFLVALSSVALAQDAGVTAGAEWLLTQQFASGAYPWTVGGPVNDNSQGGIARGMLVANAAAPSASFLDSAIRSGNYLVNSYPRHFSDGDPDFHPLDPLFLEELSLVTGDPTYASFVQTNLWDKLKAGTYGEGNDQDAAAWAATLRGFPEYPWVALEPFFRASPAIAAHYTGETGIRDALMSSLLLKLEQTTTSTKSGDLTGLAAAIWASAHTGINLDPKAGRWTTRNSTQDLVNALVGYQRAAGDWPYDTSNFAAAFVGDVAVTATSVLALKAWNRATYADNIDRGLQFIRGLQQPNGQILTNPGYPPTADTGVLVHAEGLIALGSSDGVLLNDVPGNQPPLAGNDAASTDREVPVVLNVLANDSDPDPDGSLDVSSVFVASAPLHGTAVVNPSTGTITYTPALGYVGLDSFRYTVNDDAGAASNEAAVSLTVTGIQTTFSFSPAADAQVYQYRPTTNYGGSALLQVRQKSGQAYRSYLRFVVSGINGTVQRARLRLYVRAGSNESATLSSASDNYAGTTEPWTESGLKWNNADPAGAALGTTTMVTGTWREFDVTSSVTTPGTYVFSLINATTKLSSFASKEGSNPPQLVIDTTP